jgi:tetratricopeptide (TPR) repeat protein
VKKLPILIIALAAGIAGAQPGAPAQGSGAPPIPDANQPPSAPGLGQQRAPDQRPLTEEEKKELKAVEGDYDQFIRAADEHDRRMRDMAKREFDARTAELEKRYAERIAKTQLDQVNRHAETIALLEKFLQDHPNHETFTPDAKFRLADLYLDAADAEVEAKLAALDSGVAPEAGSGSAAPDTADLVADYSKAIAQWEDILNKFPSYRQTPSTLYLLAYYGKAKDERRSLQIFLALACANHYKWNDKPPAIPTRDEAIKRVEAKTLRDPYADCTAYPGAELELVRHAWVRGIADYHFTIAGELDEAIAAYKKVSENGQDSKLYAESLYKLAWSFYKRDRLKDSIENFDKSVKLYDEIVAQGGQPPLELRDESIQYIAVAFTDPWEGETDTDPVKAFDRAKDYYKGRENEPHVRDVWVALGHAFEDLQAWDQAVDAYRIAIGPPWELHPHNPIVHQQIVNAFESKGDKFAADSAAAELATRYAPGTAWYTANEKDREAMETQHRIAERALYAAARNTHAAATQLRKDAQPNDAAAKQEYLAMYAKAVDLYKQFINTYPESDYVYEFMFLEGEALYYSERYDDAIAQYQWVRDHRDLGTQYYLDAARAILAAYEEKAKQLVAAGQLQPLKIPTVAELQAKPQPWQPEPIPDTYLKLQTEYDNYQNFVNDPQEAPGQGINAALISLAYLHTDDALGRFGKVMETFCHTPPKDPRDPKSVAPAAKAKDGMLAIYQAQNNFDAIQTTNNRFVSLGCGDKAAQDLAITQNRSLEFSRAGDAYKKGRYIEAAESYYRFYKKAPATDPDVPVALYNAAVAYKLGDRPKTAIALFREFSQRPEKSFRESPYYLDALRLQAASQQAAFQYDEAVKTYLDLYDTTKKAKKLGIKAPDPLPGQKPLTLDQIGLDAVYNAAFAAELNRDFKRSVDLYGQYTKIESDKDKQSRATLSIANIYKQSGDVNSMSETLDRWRAKYGKDHPEEYIKSFSDTAELYRRKGNTAKALQAEQATIDAWTKMGAQPNTPGAKLAGNYELSRAEETYDKTWTPFEIKTAAGGSKVDAVLKQMAAQRAQIDAVKKKAEDKYIGLDKYQVPEITMAAKVRYGDIQYDYGQKIANIPIPKLIQNNDAAIEKFEAQRDENLKKFLNEAKTDWAEVVDLSKKNGISNKWSQHANENLAREFPDEYQVLRQEIIQGTDTP